MRKAWIAIPLILVTLLTSGCSTIDNFFGGKSNLPPPAALRAIHPELQITKLWSVDPTSGNGNLGFKLVPAVSGPAIYTAGVNGKVVAVSRQTGGILWSHNLNTEISSGPGVGNGIVAVTTGNGYLVALNAHTGKLAWYTQLDTESLAAPVISQGVVVAKTINGSVYGFNAKTGGRLWVYKHGTPKLVLRGSSVPAISGRYVVAGFADGKIVALTLQRGNILWERTIAIPRGTTQVQQLVDIDADPKISTGTVYVATYQGNVAGVSLQSSQVQWHHRISAYSGLAVGPTQVFVTDANSHIWSFDIITGDIDWKNSELNWRYVTGPAVMPSANAVIVGDKEGYLHCLSTSDGRIIGRVSVGGNGMVAAPVVRGNTVYVVTRSGKLAAYRITLLPKK